MISPCVDIEPTPTLGKFPREYSRQGEGDGVTRDDELIGEIWLSYTVEFITNPTKLFRGLLV
jgi:hypothetical protein